MAVPFPKMVNDPVETVFCNWCHLPVEKGKFRLTSKSQEKYKCHRCSSTFAKCHNAKGMWPTAEFKEFEDQEQIDFYREAGELSKSSDVVKLMTFTLNKYQKKEFSWANGGQYLPLSVWETQGFDGDRIKRTSTPEDIQENAQAGTCYRVRLFSTIETGTTGWQTSQSLSSQSGDINRTATPQLTSSTAAETREQFADRLKNEKLQRAAREKEENKKRTTAIQLLKKLASPVDKLSNTLASGNAANLPAALRHQRMTCAAKPRRCRKSSMMSSIIQRLSMATLQSSKRSPNIDWGWGYRIIVLQAHTKIVYDAASFFYF